MLYVLAPVHMTQANCCYEMMHTASLRAVAHAFICLFLLLAIQWLRGGFVRLAYTYSMYGLAYAMCISPCA